jgi:hypothetical protein
MERVIPFLTPGTFGRQLLTPKVGGITREKASTSLSRCRATASHPARRTGTRSYTITEPCTEADLHAKALRDGPLRFAQLRISYQISPMTLLQDCIGKYPDVYTEGVDTEGHPTIGLQPGAPPLDVLLERAPLLELIKASATNRGRLCSNREPENFPRPILRWLATS